MSEGYVVQGLEHVQLAILPGGEDTAREFYGHLLGLPEVEKPENLRARGGCWFQAGAHQLHLGIEDPVAPSRRHPAILVNGIDALRARLESAGTETDPGEPLPGYHRFYCNDPFGNRLEFLERAEG